MKPLCILVFLFTPCVLGQSTDLNHAVEVAKPWGSQFKRSVEPMLTPEQRAVAEETDFEILNSWEVQARARRLPDGKRVILVNAGLLVILNWIAEANLSMGIDHRSCFGLYVEAINSTIDHNTKAHLLNEPQQLIQEPFRFAAQNPKECLGVSASSLDSDEGKQGLQWMSEASYTWLFAHELAHQLHGDVDHKFAQPMTQRELETSRTDEMEADKFAFKILVRSSLDPLWATPAYIFVLMRGASIEDEGLSTHPSGIRRFQILTDAIDADTNDQSFKRELQKLGKWDQWQQDVAGLHSLGLLR